MKITKNLFLVGILTLGALASGCSIFQSGTTANNVTEIAVTDGAEAATAAVLNKNPQFEPDFMLGAGVLTALTAGTNTITAQSIVGTLDSANVTNTLVQTVIVQGVQSAATLLNNQTNAVVQQQQVNEVMSWIATGIVNGVNLHDALNPPKK